jgi:hypothetical protein
MKHLTFSTQKRTFFGITLMIAAYLTGSAALLRVNFADLSMIQLDWSAVLLLPGGFLLIAGLWQRAAGNLMAMVAGAMIGAGLLLHSGATLATWTYGWALALPVASGIAQLIQGALTAQPAMLLSGARWMALGASAFVSCFVIFELLLNISGGGLLATGEARLIAGLALLLGGGLACARMLAGAAELPAEVEFPVEA